MKRFLGLATGVFLIGFVSSAEAAIKIEIAEVQNGAAFVQGGKAAASATITWEGGNVAKANQNGGFNFSGIVPADCVGTLSDGVSTIQVIVLDCIPALSLASNRVVNGGFETGDLTGWSTIGDVSVQTSSFGTPIQSKFQALITNAPLFTPLACWGDPKVCGSENPDMPLSFSGNYGGDALSNDGLCFLFDAPL